MNNLLIFQTTGDVQHYRDGWWRQHHCGNTTRGGDRSQEMVSTQNSELPTRLFLFRGSKFKYPKKCNCLSGWSALLAKEFYCVLLLHYLSTQRGIEHCTIDALPGPQTFHKVFNHVTLNDFNFHLKKYQKFFSNLIVPSKTQLNQTNIDQKLSQTKPNSKSK